MNKGMFTIKDAEFLWRICGRIEGVIEMMSLLPPDNEKNRRIKQSLEKTKGLLMDYTNNKMGIK